MAKVSSGQRVLAELSADPVALRNKHTTITGQIDALERRLDYLEGRLENAQNTGNQTVYNAVLKQYQDMANRVQSLATEANSIGESIRYQSDYTNRQQKITDSKPKTTMDKVRESLPYQLGSGIRDMIVDTGKGLGQTALYADNAIRGSTLGKNDKGFATLQLGKAGTQGSVMNPEDITMGDVAGEYATALGENTGFYGDVLNSMMHWRQGRLKPDSEDEKYAKMFGGAVRDAVGTKPLEDDTVLKGARMVADPFAVLGGGTAVLKTGANAIDNFGDIAKGFRRGDGKYVPMGQAGMFVPVTPWSEDAMSAIKDGMVSIDNFEDVYPDRVKNAYKEYKELEAQGLSPEEIFRKTRIFKNVDGVPYYETDDSIAQVDVSELHNMFQDEGVPADLNNVMFHPDLEEYQLNKFGTKGNMPTEVYRQEDGGGTYYPREKNISINTDMDDMDIESVLFHEVNHKLANDAGLPNSGYNMVSASVLPKSLFNDKLTEIESQLMREKRDLATEREGLKSKRVRLEPESHIYAKEIEEIDQRLGDIFRQSLDKESKLSQLRSRANKINVKDNDYMVNRGIYLGNNQEAMARLAEARLMLGGDKRWNQFPLDREYFKDRTGFYPEHTWYSPVDITNPSKPKMKYKFPDEIEQSIRDFLTGEMTLDEYAFPDMTKLSK